MTPLSHFLYILLWIYKQATISYDRDGGPRFHSVYSQNCIS